MTQRTDAPSPPAPARPGPADGGATGDAPLGGAAHGAGAGAASGAPEGAACEAPEGASAPRQRPLRLWEHGGHLVRRLGPAGPLALMASTLPPLCGLTLLSLLPTISPWFHAHPGLGAVVFAVGFVALGGMSLLPIYVLSIFAGWTFKFWLGFPLTMTGSVGAALLAYAVNSRAAGNRVMVILEEHPRWDAVRRALIGSGFWRSLGIIALLRLSPTSPFALTNLLMASVRAPLGPFLIATLVGLAPRIGAVVWAAANASRLDFDDTNEVWFLVAGVVISIVLIAVIGVVANRTLRSLSRGGRE